MPVSIDIATVRGLSEAQARERLKTDGYNELPQTKKKNTLKIALEVFREPMFLLLLSCGAIYLILGDIKEAVMLLSFVFVVMGITLYQERKTERALEALRDLTSPRALVIRDGIEKRIPGREVVRGDILILNEGDRVPADGVVVTCANFHADESLLTGESVPVLKKAMPETESMGKPGGDNLPFVFSGTLIVKGHGLVKVLTTGINSEIGKIGKSLNTLEIEDTLLQIETRKIVRNIAVFGGILCLLVILIYGLSTGSWLNGFLSGIALAMALLPEEFPVVLTIFLALGAWRMSKKRVLTRRIPAIETLGATTVLCVDKTGTITQNKMAIAKIYNGQDYFDFTCGDKKIPEAFHHLLEYAILASQKKPFDPMEKAVRTIGEKYLIHTEHVHDDWTLIHEYPLSQSLLALSHVWQSTDKKDFLIAAKGAPEAIADLCHLTVKQKTELSKKVAEMASLGLRVLGVAESSFQKSALPKKQHDFRFHFLGLLGLSDPVRPTVKDALADCYRAGIRVAMITGDYPVTAQNIARQIGLKNPEKYLTGSEIERMDYETLKKRIQEVNIFARVVPEQKLQIVRALKDNGEIVAMTGDGVNDAPALKAANIGVAMGGRGCDVAREAGSIVVLDDDFSSIVSAVRMGRRIFDNLKKAIAYILAIHVPIAGLSLIPVILRWPLVLYPMHIVFMELIIDPACSVVFEQENEEKDVMERSPRNCAEPLFNLPTVVISILQGLGVLIAVLAVFFIGMSKGLAEGEARALTFMTLIIANLGLIATNRSWSRTFFSNIGRNNRAFWYVSLGAIFFLGIVLFVPFFRELFHFQPLHPSDILIAFLVGISSVLWFELFKLFKTRSYLKTLSHVIARSVATWQSR
ncbi:cation-translocating P-type ATPase [Candidatus Microgenomates bacterium]|nr:cation-translocating P-type ATPase [Candidatus Microgenomates bacterium]